MLLILLLWFLIHAGIGILILGVLWKIAYQKIYIDRDPTDYKLTLVFFYIIMMWPIPIYNRFKEVWSVLAYRRILRIYSGMSVSIIGGDEDDPNRVYDIDKDGTCKIGSETNVWNVREIWLKGNKQKKHHLYKEF